MESIEDSRIATNHLGQEKKVEAWTMKNKFWELKYEWNGTVFPHSLQNSIGRGVIWGHVLRRGPGTFHAFTTIKEREKKKKACLLLFLIPSSKPSKILPQKDYPLTPTSSQPVVSLRPQLNWSRGAGKVSSQKKSLLLVIKYHLNCTGPSGISWVSKGQGLMRMQTF